MRVASLGAGLLVIGCTRPEVGTGAPPEAAAPEIRIGVVVGAGSITVGGGGGVVLSSPDGGARTELPGGTVATVSAGPAGLRVGIGAAVESPGVALIVTPSDSGGGAPVRINGHDYRGRFTLSPAPGGVMAVNLLGIEEYLEGVVGAEMGRRGAEDLAGMRAQAVVSRSFALRNLGKWRLRGYDLVATVADQAYAGTGFEFPLSTQAVVDTRGEVLTFQGQLIDAFFHSTCGGRTADGIEVYPGADRPYLRSIRDVDAAGQAWCAISPRFHWRESWNGEALARILREALPQLGPLRDLQVLDRTPTGRVARMGLVGDAGSLTVSGPIARSLLRSSDGSILRSANFTLQVSREGGRIVQVVVEGSGAGHGVGMCQWGAIGRSRAGFSYREILSAYFPQTEVTRNY